MKLISKATWAYGIFLVISASFLQQIFFFLNKILGEYTVGFCFFCLLIIFIFILIYQAIKNNHTGDKLTLLLSLIIFSVILISVQRFFAERAHVIMYGFLGYWAIKDVCKAKPEKIKAIIYASFFTLLINISDEIFQAILPYRVGELQDILTNYLSSAIGIMFYFTLNRQQTTDH